MPTILIAEDEAPLRALLCRTVEHIGFEVLEAADGLQALRLGSEYSGPIALLIADIRMPGMEGTEVYSRLKEQRPDLNVLFISGYAQGRALKEPFLAKPFPMATLVRKIHELTQSRGK